MVRVETVSDSVNAESATPELPYAETFRALAAIWNYDPTGPTREYLLVARSWWADMVERPEMARYILETAEVATAAGTTEAPRVPLHKHIEDCVIAWWRQRHETPLGIAVDARTPAPAPAAPARCDCDLHWFHDNEAAFGALRKVAAGMTVTQIVEIVRQARR